MMYFVFPTGKGKSVFLLTVMKRDVNGDAKRDRTWAWYSRFEDAERDVLNNEGDMFEDDYYDHAVAIKSKSSRKCPST